MEVVTKLIIVITSIYTFDTINGINRIFIINKNDGYFFHLMIQIVGEPEKKSKKQLTRKQ